MQECKERGKRRKRYTGNVRMIIKTWNLIGKNKRNAKEIDRKYRLTKTKEEMKKKKKRATVGGLEMRLQGNNKWGNKNKVSSGKEGDGVKGIEREDNSKKIKF